MNAAIDPTRVGPRRLRRFLARPGAWLLAIPVVIGAAVRVALLENRAPIGEIVNRLRQGRHLPAYLANPDILTSLTHRLAPVLPPWTSGLCYRRSLMLIHLLSRCNQRPTLHLGIRYRPNGKHQGHAWITRAGEEETAGTERIKREEAEGGNCVEIARVGEEGINSA